MPAKKDQLPNLNIRMTKDDHRVLARLCKELGLNVSSVVRVALRELVRQRAAA
jgi:antitoxin component of RelBE/YafQ-DinJ toxin-antitoxin module